LAVSEPVLVAFPDDTLVAQKIVLAVSSAFFLFGYAAVMFMMPSGNVFRRFWDDLLPEVFIEIFCLIIGWALIFEDPGMACLRCFRVFRFVWYTEFYRAKKKSLFYPLTFFSHVVLQYLEKIGQELFTTSSKGGVVVLGFFFYMAYVFGVSFWQQTRNFVLTSPEGGPTGTLSECDTLRHCWLIMIRLTFWDGSGFDYLKSVMDANHGALVALLLLYMCISAMVLLNGLIGIFGGAFQAATAEEDEEGEDDDEDEEDGEEGEEKEGEEKEGEEDAKGDAKGKGKEKDNNKKILIALDRIEQLCKKLEGGSSKSKPNADDDAEE